MRSTLNKTQPMTAKILGDKKNIYRRALLEELYSGVERGYFKNVSWIAIVLIMF